MQIQMPMHLLILMHKLMRIHIVKRMHFQMPTQMLIHMQMRIQMHIPKQTHKQMHRQMLKLTLDQLSMQFHHQNLQIYKMQNLYQLFTEDKILLNHLRFQTILMEV